MKLLKILTNLLFVHSRAPSLATSFTSKVREKKGEKIFFDLFLLMIPVLFASGFDYFRNISATSDDQIFVSEIIFKMLRY